jgi:pyruvate/2-oxoglutarate dehydrogenase complex dihydrolipoamide dehydrogenase (E3) component
LDEGHEQLDSLPKESANTVSINDQILEANKIILNAGGRVTKPPIPGIEDVDYFTDTNMMEVDFLPNT